jgi:signal transduction histidine kinase
LFDKLEQQNVDLIRNQGEIAAQNEELVQSREELASQRDKVAEQNHKIEEARKVIEAQHQILFEKNEDLENQIAKRTKELVEYNQQLEQFAFMSSHNLRAPIARILGLGNLLELTNEKSDETKIQQNLIAAARELDRVVKDLNTILEIRKNNISSVQEIDLAEEFDLIRLNLEKEITETNTTLTVDFSGATSIRTVRPYLDSILINLVSNAIKYRHPDRKPIVEVKSGFRGDLFFLEVKDNGVGIDLDTYGHKIFTLYSRFHNHVEGKGLGLYLVKTQCEALGGNVTVTSNLQIGTTFTASFKPSTQ